MFIILANIKVFHGYTYAKTNQFSKIVISFNSEV